MEKEQKITAKENFLKLVKRVKDFEDECNNNRKLLQELLDYSIEDFHEVLDVAQKVRGLYHRKQEEFKDGDILHSKGTDRIVIFKSYETELKGVFCSYYNNGKIALNSGWLTHSFRHATEEEKQAFFDTLKENGLHWNAETKTMEKKKNLKVRIKKLVENAVIPHYAKSGDAGLDLTVTKVKHKKGKVKYYSGLAFEIPQGYVGLLFPRSSNANKDLLMTNSVGVIDSGYRGEVTAVFQKTTLLQPEKYHIGDRFAQLIILPYPQIEFEEVEELSTTERGANGYGSTGK